MLHLDETQIQELGVEWERTIDVIEEAVGCLRNNDFAQPLKPYLRYRDPRNRIIAMPAFVGGTIDMAGIKWIASFPGNILNGLPRAHCVVVLNDAATGEPRAIISTARISMIRTASVSGMMIRWFHKARRLSGITLGIIGFGPIGKTHLDMCLALLGSSIEKIIIYDIRPIAPAELPDRPGIKIAASWKEAYTGADLFITCTVSAERYIDERPKAGSLHLNVSLRDYRTEAYEWFRNAIIVDDWEEVCREKTDIEMMHVEKGLQKEDTRSILDVVGDNCLAGYDRDTAILFNPMGMAVFDIAIGAHYYRTGLAKNRLT